MRSILIYQILFLELNKIINMKNYTNKKQNHFIYGINNSYELLQSDKFIIISIFLLKNSRAYKEKKIKNKINRFKEKLIILEKNDFNKKFQSIRSQGIVINFLFSYKVLPPVFSNQNTCLLIPEEIEDPQNLGQIIRTSECAGIDGILISKHRNVGITSSVLQVSQGAFLNFPIYSIGNISQTLLMLKKEGFWIIGVENSIDASNWYDIDYSGKIVFIFGSEGRGVKPNTLKKCDSIVTIPMLGKINSLNISASVSAVLFERNRQLSIKK